MTRPLALVVYEALIPGTQVANKLRDLGYRVQTVGDARSLVEHARRETPLVILADLSLQTADVCGVIRRLKSDGATWHIPILAFVETGNASLEKAAMEAGVTLVASREGIVDQLEALLDQALHVD